MTYYQVKKEADQRRKTGTKYDIYISNELYTPAEVKKQNLNADFLKTVEISKKKTYFFFGARFAKEV